VSDAELLALLRPHLARLAAALRHRADRERAATFAADSEDSPLFRPAFAADHAAQYARYFAHEGGLYPTLLHRQFGLGVKDFADRTGLVRKQIEDRNGRRVWHWVRPDEPAAAPSPAATAPDPTPEPAAGRADHGPEAVGAAVAADVAASSPEVQADPTLRAKVADLALTCAAKVYQAALEFTNSKWAGRLGEVLEAVFDVPSDMAKLGYNPNTSSGTAGPQVLDPVRSATGISGHLVASIASKVIVKALFWLKGKLKGAPGQMADEGDWVAEAAGALADLYDAANAAVGLPPVDRSAVRAALEKVAGGESRKAFASEPTLGPVVSRPTAALAADPDRFQFRRAADPADGTARPLPDAKFDPARCEPLAAWTDPADGRDYVVDGHHRRAWAERDGVAELPVRFIDAPTAAAARDVGERLNRARTFAAPGPPPHPGWEWHEETRRWRNPKNWEESAPHEVAGRPEPAAPAPPGSPEPTTEPRHAAAWKELRKQWDSEPESKHAAAARKYRDTARRRRVIKAVKNEGELAAAIGGHNLPDSEPADVVHVTTPDGKRVTDGAAVKQFLRDRELGLRWKKNPPPELIDPASRPEYLATLDPGTRAQLLKHYKEDAAERERVKAALASECHFFEVKTLLVSATDAVHMSKPAMKRKERWMRRYGISFHTVALDDRRGKKFSGNRVYVIANAFGSTVRLDHMEKAPDMAAVLGLVGATGKAGG
jgi:hypothetical protein